MLHGPGGVPRNGGWNQRRFDNPEEISRIHVSEAARGPEPSHPPMIMIWASIFRFSLDEF